MRDLLACDPKRSNYLIGSCFSFGWHHPLVPRCTLLFARHPGGLHRLGCAECLRHGARRFLRPRREHISASTCQQLSDASNDRIDPGVVGAFGNHRGPFRVHGDWSVGPLSTQCRHKPAFSDLKKSPPRSLGKGSSILDLNFTCRSSPHSPETRASSAARSRPDRGRGTGGRLPPGPSRCRSTANTS